MRIKRKKAFSITLQVRKKPARSRKKGTAKIIITFLIQTMGTTAATIE
jgi:hypothetical protein